MQLLGRTVLRCALAPCLGLGCIAGSQAAEHPLYSEDDGPVPRERVARLVGYVQSVDGRDVSELGGAYLLLPGCHLVLTPSEWGLSDPHSAVTAHTGHWPFVLLMRAGRQYRIEVQSGAISGPVGSLSIKAYEQDADGKELGVFGPAQGDALQQCRDQLADPARE